MLFFQLILGNCIFKNDSSVFLALETGKINDGELFPHIKRGAYRYIIHSLIHFLEQIDHLLLSLFLIFISHPHGLLFVVMKCLVFFRGRGFEVFEVKADNGCFMQLWFETLCHLCSKGEAIRWGCEF